MSHREIGQRVRDAIKKAKYSLSIAIKTTTSYPKLILAIGLDDKHHYIRG